MTTILTGRSSGASIISLPSTSQEEHDSFQPTSLTTSRTTSRTTPQTSSSLMATANVASTFGGLQNRRQYDESIHLMNDPHSLQILYPSSCGGEGMQMENNYQIFQPPPSYISPQATDYSNYSHQAFTGPQYAPGIDPTCPRSVSPSIVSAHDGSYSPFSSTVAPHQVYPNLPPTSYPSLPFPENEYNQHVQRDGDLVTSQEQDLDHQILIPTYNQQHHEVASHRSTPFDDGMSYDGDNDGDKAEPYAKSLFRCLRDAPGHTMVLREIYDWFKANTEKARDPGSTGWQNSIRHNLSMNKAFEKVEAPGEDPNKKGGYQWRLSEQALRDGRVQSTTRYRNKDPKKRGHRNHHPAPHRQASGARGGIMSRRSHQLRQSERLRKLRRDSEDHSIQLRAQGIIGPNHGGTSRSAGFESHPATVPQSSPSSPYFFPQEPLYALPSDIYDSQSINYAQYPTPTQQNGSARGTPEAQDVPDLHFGPLRGNLFYDESGIESGSEPQTPASAFDYNDSPYGGDIW